MDLELTERDQEIYSRLKDRLKTPLQNSDFGACFKLPCRLCILLGRYNSGLKAFSNSWATYVRLGHQIYLKDFEELLTTDLLEVVALDLSNGDQTCLFLAKGEKTCVVDKTANKNLPFDQIVYRECRACAEEVAEDEWLDNQCPVCGIKECPVCHEVSEIGAWREKECPMCNQVVANV